MTPKRITYRMDVNDPAPGPDVGDVLLSSRSAYVVVTARLVRSRKPGVRAYALGVHRYSKYDCYPIGRRTFKLVWDSRAPSRQRSAPPLNG